MEVSPKLPLTAWMTRSSSSPSHQSCPRSAELHRDVAAAGVSFAAGQLPRHISAEARGQLRRRSTSRVLRYCLTGEDLNY